MYTLFMPKPTVHLAQYQKGVWFERTKLATNVNSLSSSWILYMHCSCLYIYFQVTYHTLRPNSVGKRNLLL